MSYSPPPPPDPQDLINALVLPVPAAVPGFSTGGVQAVWLLAFSKLLKPTLSDGLIQNLKLATVLVSPAKWQALPLQTGPYAENTYTEALVNGPEGPYYQTTLSLQLCGTLTGLSELLQSLLNRRVFAALADHNGRMWLSGNEFGLKTTAFEASAGRAGQAGQEGRKGTGEGITLVLSGLALQQAPPLNPEYLRPPQPFAAAEYQALHWKTDWLPLELLKPSRISDFD